MNWWNKISIQWTKNKNWINQCILSDANHNIQIHANSVTRANCRAIISPVLDSTSFQCKLIWKINVPTGTYLGASSLKNRQHGHEHHFDDQNAIPNDVGIKNRILGTNQLESIHSSMVCHNCTIHNEISEICYFLAHVNKKITLVWIKFFLKTRLTDDELWFNIKMTVSLNKLLIKSILNKSNVWKRVLWTKSDLHLNPEDIIKDPSIVRPMIVFSIIIALAIHIWYGLLLNHTQNQ